VPIYVVAAALAVTVSLPILWFTLAADHVPGRRVSRNLTAGLGATGDLRGLVLSQSPVERLLQPLLLAFVRPARRVSPAGMVAALERRLELAGASWTIERLLVFKLGLGGAALAGSALFWALPSRSALSFLGTALLGFAGYVAPDAVLARMAGARQLKIANRLPDTLDQLSICIEAGLGFDAALARTAQAGAGPRGRARGADPLAVEVSQLLQDVRMGVPRREALESLVARTDVADLRQFVHAVSQAEIYGIPIARVLRAQADEQRERRRFRAEERAMKLPVKIVFPLVFCILPTLFIVVLGPAAIKLANGLG
jgi:tight adherence protein C